MACCSGQESVGVVEPDNELVAVRVRMVDSDAEKELPSFEWLVDSVDENCSEQLPGNSSDSTAFFFHNPAASSSCIVVALITSTFPHKLIWSDDDEWLHVIKPRAVAALSGVFRKLLPCRSTTDSTEDDEHVSHQSGTGPEKKFVLNMIVDRFVSDRHSRGTVPESWLSCKEMIAKLLSADHADGRCPVKLLIPSVRRVS